MFVAYIVGVLVGALTLNAVVQLVRIREVRSYQHDIIRLQVFNSMLQSRIQSSGLELHDSHTLPLFTDSDYTI
jgi:hypothetical protein